MKNVTKQDLVMDAARASGRIQIDVKAVTEHFMDLIAESLAAGSSVEIRGFGTFFPRKRKPRPARNPRTGAVCHIPECRVPLFRASADITFQMNQEDPK